MVQSNSFQTEFIYPKQLHLLINVVPFNVTLELHTVSAAIMALFQ